VMKQIGKRDIDDGLHIYKEISLPKRGETPFSTIKPEVVNRAL